MKHEMKMGLDAIDTIALTIAANDNRISGRTVVQKIIYFNKVKIPEINITPYVAYYYGPFNREIALGLEKMVVIDYLQETKIQGYHDRYLYQITDAAIPMVEKLKKTSKSAFQKIKSIVDQCDDFCNLNPNTLSVAAKIHYMLVTNKKSKECGMSLSDAVNIAKKFGWDISKKEVENGAELLEQLQFVKYS
jgi:uncharacterized protein YwgA